MYGELVYFILAGEWMKVGYARDVQARMKQLQTGNPLPLDLVMTLDFLSESDARRAETKWRNAVGKDSIIRGEWVLLEHDAIGQMIQSLGEIRAVHVCDLPISSDIEILDGALAARGFRRVVATRAATEQKRAKARTVGEMVTERAERLCESRRLEVRTLQ